MNYTRQTVDSQPYRIPKTEVNGSFYLIDNEIVEGDIYLDVRSVSCSTSQLLESFNSEDPFFPVKTGASSSILAKAAVIKAEFPKMMSLFLEETASSLCVRKHAELHFITVGSIQATLILDLPEEHSRLLDLLNKGKTFVPAIEGRKYVLLNLRHLTRVKEI